MTDEYRKQLFEEEFGKKDDWKMIKVGILFFIIVSTAVFSIWAYFRDMDVQEKEKQQQEYQRQMQAYYQQQQQEAIYQQQKQQLDAYNQQQQAEYQRKLDAYNQTIKTPIQLP